MGPTDKVLANKNAAFWASVQGGDPDRREHRCILLAKHSEMSRWSADAASNRDPRHPAYAGAGGAGPEFRSRPMDGPTESSSSPGHGGWKWPARARHARQIASLCTTARSLRACCAASLSQAGTDSEPHNPSDSATGAPSARPRVTMVNATLKEGLAAVPRSASMSEFNVAGMPKRTGQPTLTDERRKWDAKRLYARHNRYEPQSSVKSWRKAFPGSKANANSARVMWGQAVRWLREHFPEELTGKPRGVKRLPRGRTEREKRTILCASRIIIAFCILRMPLEDCWRAAVPESPANRNSARILAQRTANNYIRKYPGAAQLVLETATRRAGRK